MAAVAKTGAHRWQPGESGNPAGRPVGARQQLSQAFLQDIAEDWEKHGMEAVRRCREEKPEVYFKTVASLMPKNVKLDADFTVTLEQILTGNIPIDQQPIGEDDRPVIEYGPDAPDDSEVESEPAPVREGSVPD